MPDPNKTTRYASQIDRFILRLRGRSALLDAHLAALYGVETRILVQAVKRNAARFPRDFMFQLTTLDLQGLRSQFVISKAGRGGRRYRPYAFTEQGVAMLSSVLNSPRAIAVNIEIMRAFVRLRGLATPHELLVARLDRLTRKLALHDTEIGAILKVIRRLVQQPPPPLKRSIGFISSQL